MNGAGSEDEAETSERDADRTIEDVVMAIEDNSSTSGTLVDNTSAQNKSLRDGADTLKKYEQFGSEEIRGRHRQKKNLTRRLEHLYASINDRPEGRERKLILLHGEKATSKTTVLRHVLHKLATVQERNIRGHFLPCNAVLAEALKDSLFYSFMHARRDEKQYAGKKPKVWQWLMDFLDATTDGRADLLEKCGPSGAFTAGPDRDKLRKCAEAVHVIVFRDFD